MKSNGTSTIMVMTLARTVQSLVLKVLAKMPMVLALVLMVQSLLVMNSDLSITEFKIDLCNIQFCKIFSTEKGRYQFNRKLSPLPCLVSSFLVPHPHDI